MNSRIKVIKGGTRGNSNGLASTIQKTERERERDRTGVLDFRCAVAGRTIRTETQRSSVQNRGTGGVDRVVEVDLDVPAVIHKEYVWRDRGRNVETDRTGLRGRAEVHIRSGNRF